MPKVKVWRDDSGNFFHDGCFEDDESRDGYVTVDLNDVDIDDSCESCGGLIFAEPDDDDEDVTDDTQESQSL